MFTTRPEIAGTFGVVATTHWIASQVGMAVLERGGNAFDAAAAAGFTLQVAEPHLNGPGGDVPIILHDAAHRHPARHLRPGRRRPRRRRSRRFAALGLDLDPRHRAAARRGARRLRRLGADAARLGHLGAARCAGLRHRLCRATACSWCRASRPRSRRVRPLFEAEWPSSAAVWLPGGGARSRARCSPTPALAATYERLCARRGRRRRPRGADRCRPPRLVPGFVAEAIDASAARPRCSTPPAAAIAAC